MINQLHLLRFLGCQASGTSDKWNCLISWIVGQVGRQTSCIDVSIRHQIRHTKCESKLQVFSLQLYQKRDCDTDVFQCIFQILRHVFFKYSFGWLLLIDSWISIKVALIVIAINVSKDSYQREFVFFSYLRSAYSKFVEISKKLFFFVFWTLMIVKKQLLQANCHFSIFTSCLMLSFKPSQMET